MGARAVPQAASTRILWSSTKLMQAEAASLSETTREWVAGGLTSRGLARDEEGVAMRLAEGGEGGVRELLLMAYSRVWSVTFFVAKDTAMVVGFSTSTEWPPCWMDSIDLWRVAQPSVSTATTQVVSDQW